MAWTKTKTSLVVTLAVLLVAGAATGLIIHHRHQPKELKDMLPSIREGHHEEALADGTFLRSQRVKPLPSKVVFHNNTGRALQLFWLDFNGQRKKYGDLKPFSSFTQGTYVTHPWLLVDSDSNNVALFVASPGNCIADINH